MPVRDTRKTVKEKLDILLEADRSRSVRGTARRHRVDPNQIRRWRRDRAKLEATVRRNPRARSMSTGRARATPEVEVQAARWIIERRRLEIAVMSNQVIAKALSIDRSFRGGKRSAMWSWIYPFPRRRRLSIRRKTRVGQKLSGHLQKVRNDFTEATNECFRPGGTLEGTPPSLRVNMDETAVFLEMTSSTTINEKNVNTVSIRSSGSNARRLTACVACAEDGTKLPLFLVFKGNLVLLLKNRSITYFHLAYLDAAKKRDGWMNGAANFGLRRSGNLTWLHIHRRYYYLMSLSVINRRHLSDCSMVSGQTWRSFLVAALASSNLVMLALTSPSKISCVPFTMIGQLTI